MTAARWAPPVGDGPNLFRGPQGATVRPPVVCPVCPGETSSRGFRGVTKLQVNIHEKDSNWRPSENTSCPT
ncbi:hypothetical protein GN956_G16825 [Arapaima gigas]